MFFTKINQQADLKLEVNKNEIVPSRSRCFWHYWSICLLNSYIRYLIHLKISAINVQQGKPGDAVSVSLVNNGWTERTVGQHSQHGVWHFLVNTDTDVNLQSHLSHRQSNLVMNVCIILLLSLQQNQSIKNPVLFNEPLRTQKISKATTIKPQAVSNDAIATVTPWELPQVSEHEAASDTQTASESHTCVHHVCLLPLCTVSKTQLKHRYQSENKAKTGMVVLTPHKTSTRWGNRTISGNSFYSDGKS